VKKIRLRFVRVFAKLPGAIFRDTVYEQHYGRLLKTHLNANKLAQQQD